MFLITISRTVYNLFHKLMPVSAKSCRRSIFKLDKMHNKLGNYKAVVARFVELHRAQ